MDADGGIAAGSGSLQDAERAVDVGRFGLRPLWFAPNLTRRFIIRRTYEEATRAAP
jgi:hypothetical protein